MAEKYQQILLHLSDGRTLPAIVPEFCKEGDVLFLKPQIVVTAPKELPEGHSWARLPDPAKKSHGEEAT